MALDCTDQRNNAAAAISSVICGDPLRDITETAKGEIRDEGWRSLQERIALVEIPAAAFKD